MATVCAIYGYTPRFVLHEMSWGQLILLQARGMEYDLRRRGVPIELEQVFTPQGDGPDVNRIETELAQFMRKK